MITITTMGFERMPKASTMLYVLGQCENVMAASQESVALIRDYILHDGQHMQVDLEEKGSVDNQAQRNMVSYDKHVDHKT